MYNKGCIHHVIFIRFVCCWFLLASWHILLLADLKHALWLFVYCTIVSLISSAIHIANWVNNGLLSNPNRYKGIVNWWKRTRVHKWNPVLYTLCCTSVCGTISQLPTISQLIQYTFRLHIYLLVTKLLANIVIFCRSCHEYHFSCRLDIGLSLFFCHCLSYIPWLL